MRGFSFCVTLRQGKGESMAKHHDKVAAALATRIANMPKGTGFKKPGSMNPRKTGYMSIKANEAKRILSK
jgi:hypothetical protein